MCLCLCPVYLPLYFIDQNDAILWAFLRNFKLIQIEDVKPKQRPAKMEVETAKITKLPTKMPVEDVKRKQLCKSSYKKRDIQRAGHH